MAHKNNRDKESVRNNDSYMEIGFGVLLGVPISTALGVAFDNIALDVGLGIAFGVVAGVVLNSVKSKKK